MRMPAFTKKELENGMTSISSKRTSRAVILCCSSTQGWSHCRESHLRSWKAPLRNDSLLFVKLVTIKERFVGGNPRVLLPLFCLFCVILICFVGICPNMMWKNWSLLTRKVGTARACGGTAVPESSTTKPEKGRDGNTARACRGTAVRATMALNINFFSLFLPHSTNCELPFSFSIYFLLFFFLFKSLRTMLHPSMGEPIKCLV